MNNKVKAESGKRKAETLHRSAQHRCASLIVAILLALLSPVAARAQTDTNLPTVGGGLKQVWDAISLSGIGSATNYAVIPYGSYGLNNHKIGGGLLALYNVNNYLGAGLGVDYLGGFSLVSGNVELKLPTRPFSRFGWTNLVVIPFIYTGIGTPMSGAGTANGGISTHTGAGAEIDLASFLGGKFGIGGAYITRTGAGSYSGKYANIFVAWHKGF